MNEAHGFLVSLDEFCSKEKYSEAQKEHFREIFSKENALVYENSREFISLAPYMNYTLRGLELCKNDAQNRPSIKSILDYDFVCRIALKEWIPLSAAVLRDFGPSPDNPTDGARRQGLSELASDIKLIVEYFLDAQGMLVCPPILIQDSGNNGATYQY
jgi:hypothetical protein